MIWKVSTMSKKQEFLMSRPSTIILAAALAVGLSGCMADEDPRAFSFVPQSIDDRYPLGAAKGPVTAEVDSSSGNLGPRQSSVVAGLARQAASAGVTPVTVAVPSGGGSSRAVAKQVAAVMQKNGVSHDQIRMTTYSGAAGGAVRISFVKTHGASRDCGVWDQDLTETSLNEPYTNHGCAVRANMAAMIADPEDIVVPKQVGENPSGNNAAAVDNANSGSAGRAARSVFTLF
jgi:pilus assembly protein CpaD